MSLCHFCARIDFRAVYRGESWEHMPDATLLPASSETCDLCRLMRSSVLQHDFVTFEDRASYWLPEPIVLRRPIIYLDDTDEDIDIEFEAHREPATDLESAKNIEPLQIIEIVLPVSGGQDVCRLGIRSDCSARNDRPIMVKERAAVDQSDSLAAFERLHEWMEICLSSHTKCRGDRPLSANRTLPTRLLYIGLDETSSCHLAITAKDDVEYAALSHCWGRRQLLTTIQSNFQTFLQNVSWSQLPKTFKDAATVARRLGLHYIWIDSLCIIQDDTDDWAREAAKMGDVYSGARVTIAATGAKDSSEGLFMQRPELARPVTLLYEGATIELFEMPDEESGGIDNSALDARAWITQEWLLSKKVIHYTRACMVWSCSTVSETENGERVYPFDKESLRSIFVPDPENENDKIDQYFYDDWADIARSYCSRTLTYDSDKPVAIQGLANKIAEVTGLVYNHGMWTDPSKPSINVSQLFWYCKHPQTGYIALKDLVLSKEGLRRPACLSFEPSWAWTSTIGHIGVHIAAREALTIPDQVRFEDKALCLSTHVMEIFPEHGPVAHVRPDDVWQYHHFFSRTALSEGSMILPHGLYYLGTATEPAGWASFAVGTRPAGEVLCCAMSRNIGAELCADDGINVLLLQRHVRTAGTFAMVGIGEVLRSAELLAQPLMNLRIE